ncbi:IclR family transcriptional regulator [Desulfosporosinus shakirovi]|uniref:IclR family transcriptional regulator n=1 Tax=Desulfosporosinus shakirovi TaxID=2885154 RepID=UPI001E28B6D1|nr:IclR family transcriptional regulator [Desulfosporosinus sp. SRJS8]MCB8818278.1 IclR family transcriptional regulator [Desulfosporosinus sp. SRJS8]
MASASGVIVQSVNRALDILGCFKGQAIELGISEIPEKMELSKSTVYGLVNTRLTKGYLEQNPQTKRYRLGIKLFELGTLVYNRMDLRNEAKVFCEELGGKYNTTVHLAAHYGDEIVYIDKVDAPEAVIVYSQTGKCATMHCTGVGKVILAFLSEDELKQVFAKEDFKKYTEHTITDQEELYRELRRIHSRGYAVDNEEIETGLRCIAAPIFNYMNQPVAAISVSAPTVRLPLEQIEAIARDVQYYALQISQRLGYRS